MLEALILKRRLIMEEIEMKKNPGRKERRRLEHEMKREHSKELQHMHIVEQRKAKRAAYKEAKAQREAMKNEKH